MALHRLDKEKRKDGYGATEEGDGSLHKIMQGNCQGDSQRKHKSGGTLFRKIPSKGHAEKTKHQVFVETLQSRGGEVGKRGLSRSERSQLGVSGGGNEMLGVRRRDLEDRLFSAGQYSKTREIRKKRGITSPRISLTGQSAKIIHSVKKKKVMRNAEPLFPKEKGYGRSGGHREVAPRSRALASAGRRRPFHSTSLRSERIREILKLACAFARNDRGGGNLFYSGNTW